MSNVSETPCEFDAIEHANYAGPNPTRTWTRAELLCNNNTYTIAQLNENKKKQLSYINNSANLTKQQKYSRIVRGVGPYANKVWATQGISYTNPNVFNLPLENNILTCHTIVSAWVTNSVDNTVSRIDTATNTVLSTIAVGSNPLGIAVSPDRLSVWVTNNGDNTVSRIDTATNTVLSTIAVGLGPIGIAVSPDGLSVWVANFSSNTVSCIITATNSVVVPPIGVGPQPIGVAVSPNGSSVWVTISAGNAVSRIDTATNTAVVPPILVGNFPQGIAVSPDGSSVWVTNSVDNTVSRIDTATNTVVVPPIVVGSNPQQGIAVSPDGLSVWVTNNFGNTVSRIDTAINTVVVPPILVGNFPQGIAVSPDGLSVWMTNSVDNTVSRIDTATNTVISTIGVGNNPMSIAIDATYTVTVEIPIIIVTGITITGSSSVVTGTEIQLGATVLPLNATNAGITWSSNNDNFATVDSMGKVTGVGAGTVSITATANDTSGVYATYTVTVEIPIIIVTGITITGSSSVVTGTEIQLGATVLPLNATNAGITWSSNNDNFATVDSMGKVTGVGAGDVSITATANDTSGVSDTYTVTVEIPIIIVTGITITGSSSVVTGTEIQLGATVLPLNATNAGITWSSNNDNFATVDSMGKVTGVGAGDVSITATANDTSGVSDTYTVTVEIPTMCEIIYLSQIAQNINGAYELDNYTVLNCQELIADVTSCGIKAGSTLSNNGIITMPISGCQIFTGASSNIINSGTINIFKNSKLSVLSDGSIINIAGGIIFILDGILHSSGYNSKIINKINGHIQINRSPDVENIIGGLMQIYSGAALSNEDTATISIFHGSLYLNNSTITTGSTSNITAIGQYLINYQTNSVVINNGKFEVMPYIDPDGVIPYLLYGAINISYSIFTNNISGIIIWGGAAVSMTGSQFIQNGELTMSDNTTFDSRTTISPGLYVFSIFTNNATGKIYFNCEANLPNTTFNNYGNIFISGGKVDFYTLNNYSNITQTGGTIFNIKAGSANNNNTSGIINNYGTITQTQGTIQSARIFNNFGKIDSVSLICYNTSSDFVNKSSGNITTRGLFASKSQGKINNYGIIQIPSGIMDRRSMASDVSLGSINNNVGGFIYVYATGTIYTSITNNGTISRGTIECGGQGTIISVSGFSISTVSGCPPP